MKFYIVKWGEISSDDVRLAMHFLYKRSDDVVVIDRTENYLGFKIYITIFNWIKLQKDMKKIGFKRDSLLWGSFHPYIRS